MSEISGEATGRQTSYNRLCEIQEENLRAAAALTGLASPAGLVGAWVPYLLYYQTLQTGRAIHVLVKAGYGDEALPLGRTLLSSVLNLTFIVSEDNTDGWALRYWLRVGRLQQDVIAHLSRTKQIDDKTTQRLRAALSRVNQAALGAARSEGIHIPQKLVAADRTQPLRTWTGLSDFEVAQRVGIADWFNIAYTNLSDVTHAQAVALLPAREALSRGVLPSLGPHFRPPLQVAKVVAGAVYYSGEAFLAHFGLDPRHRSDLVANRNRVLDALDEYASVSGVSELVDTVFQRS